jgi:hypothetical protein
MNVAIRVSEVARHNSGHIEHVINTREISMNCSLCSPYIYTPLYEYYIFYFNIQ